MRLFTAISCPSDIKALLERFSGGVRNVRWVNPLDYHLTLTFHESVSYEEYQALLFLLDQIPFEPFELSLDGTGIFPLKQGAVLFAGVKKSAPLMKLQSDIASTLKAEGFNVDSKRFKPHVTLGRSKNVIMEELDGFLQDGVFLHGTFTVNHFSLFSSQLTSDGAVYTEEERFN